MNLTDRQRVELILPAQMMLEVVQEGADPNEPDAKEARRLLFAAIEEVVNDLNDNQKHKIIRRALRAHTGVLNEHRKVDARVDKVGLIVFYLIKALTDSDYIILHAGSSMQRALDLILPALEPSAQVPLLDNSAQKAARKVLSALQAEGYYQPI